VPLSSGGSPERRLPPAWETAEPVRAHTGLPVAFKGILIAEDTRRAAEAGAGRDHRVQPPRPSSWTMRSAAVPQCWGSRSNGG